MVGTYCWVRNCGTNSNKNPGISFHTFPNNKKFKQAWVESINKRDSEGNIIYPKSYHRICGKHFLGGKPSPKARVPSIFSFTENQNIKAEVPEKICISLNPDDILMTETKSKPEVDIKEEIVPENNNIPSPENQPSCSCKVTIDALEKSMEYLQNKFDEAENEKTLLEQTNAALQLTVEVMSFGIASAKKSPSMMKFYTSFENYEAFLEFYQLFKDKVQFMRYIGSRDDATVTARGRRGPDRSLKPEDELFLVLSHLKVGLLQKDLAFRYNISETAVSRICSAWIDLLCTISNRLPLWLSKQIVYEKQCY